MRENEMMIEKINQAALEKIEPWLRVGLEPPVLTVKEIERAIGANSPKTTLRAILSPASLVAPIGLGKQKAEDWLRETERPQPSKKADRIKAELWEDGQRYQRRSQFPNGNTPKTTRKKADARTSRWQLKNVKIKVFPQGKPRVVINETKTRTERRPAIEKNIGLGVVKTPSPDLAYQQIQTIMERTAYWAPGLPRQTLTPDVLSIDDALLSQIEQIVQLETKFWQNLLRRYRKEVELGQGDLTQLLEGPLAGTPVGNLFREWLLATPVQSMINFGRADLILSSTPEALAQLSIAEVNIISCGSAPAILYREAQSQLLLTQKLTPATEGLLPFLFDWAGEIEPSAIAMIGTTPQKTSDLIYEGGSQEAASLLRQYGITAGSSQLTDLEIKADGLYLPGQSKPIGGVYFFGDPYTTPTETELASPQGKLLLELYRQGKIQMLPAPVWIMSDNKALEAIVWAEKYQDLIPAGLREFVPKTEIISPGNQTCQELIGGNLNWQDYVVKSIISTGGGRKVIIGYETRKKEFVDLIKVALAQTGCYVIQKFQKPSPVKFRTKGGKNNWRERDFYLRIEPTFTIDLNGKAQVVDLFMTGRPGRMKVCGGKDAIMSTVVSKKPNDN